MDVTTYALLIGKIKNIQGIVENLPPMFDYKGSVNSTADLPVAATTGDAYSVGTYVYFWDGSAWKQYSPNPITNEQIDAVFA